jgi:ketosteroid isomerase-like protein
MSNRAAIENVLAGWSFAFDENEAEGLGAAFTEDAELTMCIGGGDLIGPFQGREALLGLFVGAIAEQPDKRRHITTNLVIDSEDATSASVRSVLTIVSIKDGGIRLLTSGRYDDTFRCESGTWRIAKRHIELDLAY